MGTMGLPGAHRGRPRSEGADRAILEAAAALLAERGLARMSIEEVAARAGVAKTTVYRRWTSKGAVALDAFVTRYLALQPLPDTGNLRGDLLKALRNWRRAVSDPLIARSLTGLIAEVQGDPVLALAWKVRVVQPIRDQWRRMFERALDRGEIDPGTDVEVAMDLVFGPGYHRLVHRHLPVTDGFTRSVVDAVLVGIGTRP